MGTTLWLARSSVLPCLNIRGTERQLRAGRLLCATRAHEQAARRRIFCRKRAPIVPITRTQTASYHYGRGCKSWVSLKGTLEALSGRETGSTNNGRFYSSQSAKSNNGFVLVGVRTNCETQTNAASSGVRTRVCMCMLSSSLAGVPTLKNT